MLIASKESFAAILMFLGLIFCSPLAIAWSCGDPLNARTTDHLSRFSSVFVGRIIQARMTGEQKEDVGGRVSSRILGKVEVMDLLYGDSESQVALDYWVRKDFAHGPGSVPRIQVGVPILFFSDGKTVSVTGCTKPLRLHPEHPTYGDGCRLERYKKLLSTDQAISPACKPDAIASGFHGRSPLSNDERNELFWRELGIDWSAQ